MITLTDNEFFTGLTNLALFMRLIATNNSQGPEKFVNSFMSETLENGNTKIFPWAAMPTVEDYKEKSSLLEVVKVAHGEEYIQITEKKLIRSSYSPLILNAAFISESGMNDFIGYILGQMESAKTDFLYDVILTDLKAKEFTGTGQNVGVGQYDRATAKTFTEIEACDLINQKEIAKQMEVAVRNLGVYTTAYNGLENKEAISLSDLKVIMLEPYNTENVINLFATLLNSSEISENFVQPEKYVIPAIKVADASNTVIGYIMHKSAYQMFYKFVHFGSFYDESNLIINNFLHFWYGKGWLENLPVIKFTATPKTLPAAAK